LEKKKAGGEDQVRGFKTRSFARTPSILEARGKENNKRRKKKKEDTRLSKQRLKGI